MMKGRVLPLVVLAVALVGSACGSSGSESVADVPTTTSSTTSTTTTTSPPLTLQDLADRLTSEVVSGECSTPAQLVADFNDELVAAAVVDGSDPASDAGTICGALSKVDSWLSANDQRLRVTSNAPLDCDEGAGEVSLEAFPALFEAVERSEIACLTIGQEDSRLTYQSRGAFDLDPSSASSVSYYSHESTGFGGGFACSVDTEILAVGGVYFAYSDLDDCPYLQGFGPSSTRSPAPIAALINCRFACGDQPIETWFASDGFILDRGWTPAAVDDTSDLTADLDVALSGLDASLFVYGRFDGTLADARLVSSLANFRSGSANGLKTFDRLHYQPYILNPFDFGPPHLDREWDTLAAYQGTEPESGLFGDCADWDIDQMARGFGGQSCVVALLEIFQFDRNTGFCSFLAEIPESGASRFGRTTELVWVDGFTPNLVGSCLVDAKVDNDDIAIGHLVPSGTYTYVNGLGVEVTVPKLTALRVVEYEDR